jgi:hypothetical protein
VEVNRRGATPGGYVFVEERRFLDPVRPTTIIVNNTVINQTVINEGPRTAVIEQASGRKMQAVPVRQLRSKEEAKVITRHPTPTSTGEKGVATPVHSQVEKPLPARASRQVERPAMTTAEPQPPATKNEVHPADAQSGAAQLDEERRVRQEKAREKENENGRPIPTAGEAKPGTNPVANHETKPQARHEAKPVAERPAITRESSEQKAGKDDEKKD